MRTNTLRAMVVVAIALGLTVGCSHVKREELATELDGLRAELRAEQQAGDDQVNQRVDGVEGRISDLESEIQQELAAQAARLEALEQDLEALRAEFNVTVEQLESAIAFNVPVHFEFDSAVLRDSDRPILERFADVYRNYYDGSLITVEGFTDEAGPAEYNKVLGMRRAEGVKGYLTEIAGLSPEQVRAVSYGESAERLINPGQYGHERGMENRRVVLVVDYNGALPLPVDNPGSADSRLQRR